VKASDRKQRKGISWSKTRTVVGRTFISLYVKTKAGNLNDLLKLSHVSLKPANPFLCLANPNRPWISNGCLALGQRKVNKKYGVLKLKRKIRSHREFLSFLMYNINYNNNHFNIIEKNVAFGRNCGNRGPAQGDP